MSFFTIGPEKRCYETISVLSGVETVVNGHKVIELSKEMNAILGSEDVVYLMRYGKQIPWSLLCDRVLVFPFWQLPGYPNTMHYLYWDDYPPAKLVARWTNVDNKWFHNAVVLRRIY